MYTLCYIVSLSTCTFRSYALEGSWEPRVDHSDGTVLGEKFQRNTKTRDVKEHSLTTAAANNIGELSHTDVDKVLNYGRDVKSLVKNYEVHQG